MSADTTASISPVEGASLYDADNPAPFRLYKSVEVVNGHEVVKYSNVASPGAEVVGRQIGNRAR